MDLDSWREWLLENPATRVPLTLTALGVLLVLPLVGFSAYMWRMTTRVLAERTFPPSGYKVLYKRPPVTGDDTVRYARIGRALSVVLLVAALVLVFQLWRFSLLLMPRV